MLNDLGGAADGSGASAGPAERLVAEIGAAGGEAMAIVMAGENLDVPIG